VNSKQRRLDRRKWRYNVSVKTPSFQRYIDQWSWLDERFGRIIAECGWREHRENADCWDITGYSIWEFERERDASAFDLRWS